MSEYICLCKKYCMHQQLIAAQLANLSAHLACKLMSKASRFYITPHLSCDLGSRQINNYYALHREEVGRK